MKKLGQKEVGLQQKILYLKLLTTYSMYGKPELREISKHFGIDWTVLDNNNWTNEEGEKGLSADQVDFLI